MGPPSNFSATAAARMVASEPPAAIAAADVCGAADQEISGTW